MIVVVEKIFIAPLKRIKKEIKMMKFMKKTAVIAQLPKNINDRDLEELDDEDHEIKASILFGPKVEPLTFDLAKKLKIGKKFAALVGHTWMNIESVSKRKDEIESLRVTNFTGEGGRYKRELETDYDGLEIDGMYIIDYDEHQKCFVSGSGNDPVYVFLTPSKRKSAAKAKRSPPKKQHSPKHSPKHSPEHTGGTDTELESASESEEPRPAVSLKKKRSPCKKGETYDAKLKRCREKKRTGPQPKKKHSPKPPKDEHEHTGDTDTELESEEEEARPVVAPKSKKRSPCKKGEIYDAKLKRCREKKKRGPRPKSQ